MTNRPISWAPGPEVFQAVPPDAVDAFLARRGWVRKRSAISLMRYYEHTERVFDDGARMHYYFPDVDTSEEYPDCARRFIENFARFYDLDPHAVLTELQGGQRAEPGRTSVPA